MAITAVVSMFGCRSPFLFPCVLRYIARLRCITHRHPRAWSVVLRRFTVMSGVTFITTGTIVTINTAGTIVRMGTTRRTVIIIVNTSAK